MYGRTERNVTYFHRQRGNPGPALDAILCASNSFTAFREV